MEDSVKKNKKINLQKLAGGIKKIINNDNSVEYHDFHRNIAHHGIHDISVNFDFNTMGY